MPHAHADIDPHQVDAIGTIYYTYIHTIRKIMITSKKVVMTD